MDFFIDNWKPADLPWWSMDNSLDGVRVALIIGLFVAIPLAIARNSHNMLINAPAWSFIYFFHGTPLLVQLYLIYYGMDQFFPVKDTLWENAWFCALVAFILNTFLLVRLSVVQLTRLT